MTGGTTGDTTGGADGPFRLVLDARARLGEGPVWDADAACLRFTDIAGKRLYAFHPASGTHTLREMDEEVGCLALSRGGGLVVAARSGLWHLPADGAGARTLIAANPEDTAVSRFNDGGTDPRGRFLAGTLDSRKAGGGALYRLDQRGLHPLVKDIHTSNGLAFSPDGRTMYHADTPRYTVSAYDYDADRGEVSNPRPYLRFTPTDTDRGRPDGAAVDAEGCYWTALYEGARVERYSPAGKRLASFPFPVPCPTMPCFGGPDLCTLYVTSAREGRAREVLDAHPLSGGVFAMDVDVPGLALLPFDPDV